MEAQLRQALRGDQPVGVVCCTGCGGWWLAFFPSDALLREDFECPHCSARAGRVADYLETLDMWVVLYGGWLASFPTLN
jgi:hypothetical protein